MINHIKNELSIEEKMVHKLTQKVTRISGIADMANEWDFAMAKIHSFAENCQ